MNRTAIISSLLLVFLTACDSEDEVAESVELAAHTEVDDVMANEPEAGFWAEVVCAPEGCWGRPSHADSLWVPVVSSCEIEALLLEQAIIPSATIGWDEFSCNPGKRPGTTPSATCYIIAGGTSSVCYGGDQGWFAEVRPSCEEIGFDEPAWPIGSCGEGFGEHGYDDVFAHPTKLDSGRAFLGTDAFEVVSACHVQSFGPEPVALGGEC